MRIACIHIPQFALQCATRLDPSLRGAAVAVVGGARVPTVVACSRAAWALGVRVGMTATAARSDAVRIVTADARAERETVRAIADALLAIAPTVDVGGHVDAHHAMYAEVPAKTRGASFGERLVDLLEELGVSARVGIADDRFTAWVAAAHEDSVRRSEEPAGKSVAASDRAARVVSVPRGGSAAFLAPRPLSLLAISAEVQHMLEALGVRTLGEFAALPAPSITRPFEADFQALARGESDAMLRPYAPEAPIREDIVVSMGNVLELQELLPAGEHAGGLSLAGALAQLAHRIALRLSGRGRAAARLEIATDEDEQQLTLERPLASADELAHVLAHALESATAEHARARDVWHLRVSVVGEAIAGEAGDSHCEHEVFGEGTAPLLRPVAADEAARDQLSVVLASTGSLFALSPPSHRDNYRRTRRGKTRRARPTPSVQPRLFDRRASK